MWTQEEAGGQKWKALIFWSVAEGWWGAGFTGGHFGRWI